MVSGVFFLILAQVRIDNKTKESADNVRKFHQRKGPDPGSRNIHPEFGSGFSW
jgi:hypothetical protein